MLHAMFLFTGLNRTGRVSGYMSEGKALKGFSPLFDHLDDNEEK